ncbi:hypothetical protein FQR65_LT15901 [Abscondita terminalis]|nr:hypothetical protein FQR65_LT15901 [Abscondita terminalis]
MFYTMLLQSDSKAPSPGIKRFNVMTDTTSIVRYSSNTKNPSTVVPGKTATDYTDVKDFFRPNLLVLNNCKQIFPEGVTFQNAPAWNLHPVLCHDLTVRNVMVRNPWYTQNGDDMESCKKCLVDNSTFDVGDDGIRINPWMMKQVACVLFLQKNVIIRICSLSMAHGGFVIGSEIQWRSPQLQDQRCRSEPCRESHFLQRFTRDEHQGNESGNISIKSKKGIEIIESTNIELKNVKVITPETKPVGHIDNSQNIKFSASATLPVQKHYFRSPERKAKIAASPKATSEQMALTVIDKMFKDETLSMKTKVRMDLRSGLHKYDQNILLYQPRHATLSRLPSAPANLWGGGVKIFNAPFNNASAEVIQSIKSAKKWFETNDIEGYRFACSKDPDAVLWARCYDLKDNRTIFGDRDNSIKYNLSEVSEERRNGYAWVCFNGRYLSSNPPSWVELMHFLHRMVLYSAIQGIEEGKKIHENIINSSISRVLSATNDWKEILKAAHRPEMQIVFSNTTEVGIVMSEDKVTDMPPSSYPGKLLAFLYERFSAFGGTPESGMVIVPAELISDNATKLQQIVFDLASQQ